jgi:hypothetical protein
LSNIFGYDVVFTERGTSPGLIDWADRGLQDKHASLLLIRVTMAKKLVVLGLEQNVNKTRGKKFGTKY